MSTPPALRTFQSLWAMEDLPTTSTPWTLDEQISLIVDAGYAGIAVDLGARKAPAPDVLQRSLVGSGLETMVFTFAGSADELDRALDYAGHIGAREIVLCARAYTQDPQQAAELVAQWHGQATAAGVDLQLETHRNTLTNDMRFTRALVEQLDPAIRIAVDLSHYIVGAEIPADPTSEIEEQISAILARAGSVQGRIASRGQVQIPLHFPSSQPWIDLTRRWWRDAFTHLLASRDAAHRDEPVTFVTELGTTPYALVDIDGVELSDRWAEARQLIQWARADLAAAHDIPVPA